MLQIVATVGLKQLTEKALESYHDKSLYTKARNWRRLTSRCRVLSKEVCVST
jgi:hypothetical protein